MVQQRIADYVRHFECPENRRFDVYHAHDGISGNALAVLKSRGLIKGYARTVHHLDAFSDARLGQLDRRSIEHADELFVVSQHWKTQLMIEMSRTATVVGNGVDMSRYSPLPARSDDAVRAKFGLHRGPVLLSVGGIEHRKNSLRILDAFLQVRTVRPSACLLIAGGASLLDHGAYQQEFRARLRSAGTRSHDVIETGIVADDEMPALYRIADVLVFPSLREGYGLAVLEAMASGLPVVTSHVAPFTEYLGPEDVAWCAPDNAGSIADAVLGALVEPLRARLIENGRRVADRHSWRCSASAHLPVYRSLEVQYA
jgi:glycosyltransferase-like protein